MFRLSQSLKGQTRERFSQRISFLQKRLKTQSHYEVLGVQKTASQKEIKDAFIKLSKKFHPDLNPSDPQSQQKFVRVSQAYEVLGKASTRREYDMNNSRPTGSPHTYTHRRPPYQHPPHPYQQQYQWYERPNPDREDMYRQFYYQRQKEYEKMRKENWYQEYAYKQQAKKRNGRFLARLLIFIVFLDLFRVLVFHVYYDISKSYNRKSTSDFIKMPEKPSATYKGPYTKETVGTIKEKEIQS